MNALPVAPESLTSPEARQRYFDDLERWGFDIAYNAFYAHSFLDLVGKLREPHVEFVAEARRRGFPSCIQIQSTVCAGDRVGISEAQYDVHNNPDRWGDRGFFGSFASDEFRAYLKELTEVFIKEYRYEMVVFEEPMYRVDIPGSEDRFYERFIRNHPGVKYPEVPRESTPYLLVQREKEDVLAEFLDELMDHATSIGARKVGVMPWFFIPTVENTPPNTHNPACNIGRIARLPNLDLLVVRMQPDNIYANVMRTGDSLQNSPLLYYFEVMAHALGKDVMTVTNPTDEHTDYPACPLIPADFYGECVDAAMAAASGGFTRHWYGQNYSKDDEHMRTLVDAAEFAPRLGQPVAPVAFVFSYSGGRHLEPHTYESVFKFYWEFQKQAVLHAHQPMLTFYADTLEEDLANHPEVQTLVLDEHFPLDSDQMGIVSKWWQESGKRAIVAFGAGLGFSADPELIGDQPCSAAYPGMFELTGITQEEEPQYVSDEPIELRDVSRIRRAAFLDPEKPLRLRRFANVRRVFGSRGSVLYEVEKDDVRYPIVVEWRDRNTLALFCGFGISEETASAAVRAVRYVMREADTPPPVIDSCDDGILWNANRNGYVVVVNTSDVEAGAVVRPGRANVWDCRAKTLLTESDPVLRLAPHSSSVYRIVGRRSKFFDAHGVSYFRSLTDGAGRAEIGLWAGRKTELLLRASPREIQVDGRASTITQQVIDGVYYVALQQCPPGERRITLRW